MHNPKAGDAASNRKKLTRWVEELGYQVAYQSTRTKNFAQALKDPGDLVVVAGGDGTVSEVARHVIGTGARLAIVPLGTANNIATALGITGKPKEVIAALQSARAIDLDVGLVRGPWGESRFFEGVGVGLFTEAMCLADSKEHAPRRQAQDRTGLVRDLRFLRRALIDFRPLTWTIAVDGEDRSGDYILCEVMNISSIGPQLALAPEANPTDGLLDVVLVGEERRHQLHRYLSGRGSGGEILPDLEVRHAHRVQISIGDAAVRIDDRIKRAGARGASTPTPSGDPADRVVHVSLEPQALPVLVPWKANAR